MKLLIITKKFSVHILFVFHITKFYKLKVKIRFKLMIFITINKLILFCSEYQII